MYRVCGAGILPFRVAPDGSVHFLLGTEHTVRGWRGSGKISAFEGGHKPPESMVENAVREFVEESLGVLCGGGDVVEALRNELRLGDYSLCVCIRNERRWTEHCTFVKRFEWAEGVAAAFQQRREQLAAVRAEATRLGECDREVPYGYPFFRPDDAMCLPQQGETTVRTVHAELVGAHGVLRVRLHLADGSWRTHRVCSPAYAARYVEILERRERLTRLVDEVPEVMRGAVRCWRYADGSVRDAAVSEEWFEKASVREYSLSELADAVCTRQSDFRPYFVHVLRQTVAQFVAPSPPATVLHTT